MATFRQVPVTGGKVVWSSESKSIEFPEAKDRKDECAPQDKHKSGSHSLTARTHGHNFVLHWPRQRHPKNLNRQEQGLFSTINKLIWYIWYKSESFSLYTKL